jgi:outer membrane immunogenic protein
MKLLASSALLTLALAAPLAAQDTYDEGQPSDYFNGFYVGGTFALDATANDDNGGFAFDTNRDGNFDNTVRTTLGADAFSFGSCGGSALGRTNTGCADDKDSYGYAIRAGVDRRVGGDGLFVAGLLVEAAKSESADYVSAFSTTPASYTITRELDHNFALRGRLGMSPGDGRGLFYVTGGVAYGKIEHGFGTTNTLNSFTETNDEEYTLGGQVGGGAELVFAPNLSMSFEYLYSSFDDEDYYVAVGQGTANPLTNPFLLNGGGTNLRAADTDLALHSFRVWLNFRF